jgi:hypothetical protein
VTFVVLFSIYPTAPDSAWKNHVGAGAKPDSAGAKPDNEPEQNRIFDFDREK